MMQEAEVTLVLAHYLLENVLAENRTIRLAIDGAQVAVGGQVVFPVRDYLLERDWVLEGGRGEEWRGSWVKRVEGADWRLQIDSRPGVGDVVADLNNGQRLRVESKGGPLARSRNSTEYRRLREALGQCLTVPTLEPDDLLAVAVPNGERFSELALQWRERPLVKNLGLRILLVRPTGEVDGLGL